MCHYEQQLQTMHLVVVWRTCRGWKVAMVEINMFTDCERLWLKSWSIKKPFEKSEDFDVDVNDML